jgi:nucleotide-binding universal stress UspA family protein
MNKILIPTDFSSTAEKAYVLAAKIARVTEAELVFIHIITKSMRKALAVNFSSIANITEYDLADEITAAKELLERIPENPLFKGLTVSTDLITDTNLDIPSAIAAYEEENEIDLVVSGTDGARTTRRNYAPVIVRTAQCPVITVENIEEGNELKNLVVATDFKNVNYKMMDKIWAIQQLFESNLTILFVNTPHNFKDSQNIENEYKLFISKFELDNTTLAVYNDHILEDGILKYADNVKADMLLMSTHGRTGVSHLFNRSHAEYIVGHAKMPVYVYNIHMDEIYYNTVSNASYTNY